MSEELRHPEIDPKLEARIVAMVLGEASDFERAELEQLIAERPELKTLQRELEDVHGALQEVGSGELPADDVEWRLSNDKREKIIATFEGRAESAAARIVVKQKPRVRPASRRPQMLMKITSLAAVACGIFLIAGLLLLPTLHSTREASNTVMSVNKSRFRSLPKLELPTAGAIEGQQESDYINSASADMKAISESLEFSSKEALEERRSEPNVERYAEQVPSQRSLAESASLASPEPSSQTWAAPAPDSEAPVFGGVVPDTSEATRSAARGKSATGSRRKFYYADEEQDGDAQPEASGPSDVRYGHSIQNRDQESAQPGGADESGRAGWGYRGGEVTAEIADRFEGLSSHGQSTKGELVQQQEAGPQGLGRQRRIEGYGDGYGAGYGGAADGGTASGDIGGGGMGGMSEGAMGGGYLGGSGAFPNVERGGYATRGQVSRTSQQDVPREAAFDSMPQLANELEAPQFGEAKELSKGLQNTRDEREELDGLTDFSIVDNTRSLERERSPSQPDSRSRLKVIREARGRGNRPDEDAESDFYDSQIDQRQTNGRSIVANGAELSFQSSLRRSVFVPDTAVPSGLDEKSSAKEPFSTFSLHVADVSFKLARAALAQGRWPDSARIRIEEFVNAFDYGDPLPRDGERVSCALEQSIHPFLQQRNVLRVSMRTAATGRSATTPLRLTFLLDNSGSMERPDRQQTVRRAFSLLAQQLKPIDQVTLISFAREARLLADQVPGTQVQQLVHRIESLPAEGGTNIESALQIAFQKAVEQRVQGAQNRIILLTDGAVNLGNANPETLSQMIARMRERGIAFDAAGICAEGLNDEILEALTRKGDGRYYLLDSAESADEGFARQLAGAMRPSAKNVKVQVEFNPNRVGQYKLLGFEKHRLRKEDFRNDKVDAAEMAAAEAGVAVYQFEPKPDGVGDVGSVSVRFRDLAIGRMVENRWPITYEPDAPRIDKASPSLRVATSAALLAAKLRDEPLGQSVELQTLAKLLASLPPQLRSVTRVQQLEQMIQQTRQIQP